MATAEGWKSSNTTRNTLNIYPEFYLKMPNKQLTPQEIDRRAGAMTLQEYHARSGSRLRRKAKQLMTTMLLSMAVAILFFLVWFYTNMTVTGFQYGFGFTKLEALFIALAGLLNYLNAWKRRRKTIRKLLLFQNTPPHKRTVS